MGLNRVQFSAAIAAAMDPTLDWDEELRLSGGYDLVIQMLEAPLRSDPAEWWVTPNPVLDGLTPEAAVALPDGYDRLPDLLNAQRFGYPHGR